MTALAFESILKVDKQKW